MTEWRVALVWLAIRHETDLRSEERVHESYLSVKIADWKYWEIPGSHSVCRRQWRCSQPVGTQHFASRSQSSLGSGRHSDRNEGSRDQSLRRPVLFPRRAPVPCFNDRHTTASPYPVIALQPRSPLEAPAGQSAGLHSHNNNDTC